MKNIQSERNFFCIWINHNKIILFALWWISIIISIGKINFKIHKHSEKKRIFSFAHKIFDTSNNFKFVRLADTSLESGLSEDYAIPPDALSSTSLESSMPSLLMRVSGESPKRQESLEKTGHLAKLGGKLKTWRKRWFVLKNGVLTYWKSQNDVNRKPQGQIILDEVCRYLFICNLR